MSIQELNKKLLIVRDAIIAHECEGSIILSIRIGTSSSIEFICSCEDKNLTKVIDNLNDHMATNNQYILKRYLRHFLTTGYQLVSTDGFTYHFTKLGPCQCCTGAEC